MVDSIQAIDLDQFDHKIGSFYISEKHPVCYIPIPKNASTWSTSYFRDILNWQWGKDDSIRSDHNYWKLWSTINYHRKIVILRDPLERWVSGVCEYVSKTVPDFEINKMFIGYLFNKKLFDAHTVFQVNFINNLEVDKIDFFYVNENLEKNLTNYLSKTITLEYKPIPINLYRNDSSEVKKNQEQLLIQLLKELLEKNANLKSDLMNFYQSDYKLINSVKFYEAN